MGRAHPAFSPAREADKITAWHPSAGLGRCRGRLGAAHNPASIASSRTVPLGSVPFRFESPVLGVTETLEHSTFMRVHLVNPSDFSFGIGVDHAALALRAGGRDATRLRRPRHHGRDARADRRLDHRPGDVVGIGIHTGNALRGYTIGHDGPRSAARSWCSAGSTPRSTRTRRCELGGAHAVVKGDGDVVWAQGAGRLRRGPGPAAVRGGWTEAADFVPARWDLLPREPVHVGVGADGARLPEALLVLFGVEDRRPAAAPAACGRRHAGDRRAAACGLPVVALADDNFYSVSLDGHPAGVGPRGPPPLRRADGAARRAVRADGPDGRASSRHDVLHADHDGGGRGPVVSGCDARRPGSRARSSASSRSRPKG